MKQRNLVIFDVRESFLVSVSKDVVTFSFILLCIYCSQGSTFWTLFTGCLAIMYLSGVIIKNEERKTKITSKQEAIEWANSLEE